MVKKLFLLFIMLFTSITYMEAQNAAEIINLQVSYDDNSNTHNSLPKAPIQIPSIYQDGHTLYFGSCIDGYAIQLVYYLNGQEVIAYSDVIFGNATSWQLPISLSGEFEIRFIIGNLRFWGYIEL